MREKYLKGSNVLKLRSRQKFQSKNPITFSCRFIKHEENISSKEQSRNEFPNN